MKLRQSFQGEMGTVLGGFSSAGTITMAHPRSLGETYEQYVLTHESTHKLLTWGTHFGMFERWAFFLLSGLQKAGTGAALSEELSKIVARAIEDSYVTHEATASYVELCLCASIGNDPETHYKAFPQEYARVITHLTSCLGMPEANSAPAPYQWIGAMLLAKLALNNTVLREFANPRSLTDERFAEYEEGHSPDARFIQLCAALKEKGGLNFILERFSAVMAGAWKRVTGGGPPRSCRNADGLSFLDLREAGGIMIHSTCWLVAEHTEWDMMRSLRAVSPGMKVYIGNEEMGRESNVFADGWRGLIKEHTGVEVPKVEVTPPADERTLNRDRTYAVRFRLDASLNEVALDELREFLNREARKKRFTVAGFLETVDEELAVFAVSLVGFETLDAVRGVGRVEPDQTFVGILPGEQFYDFALLAWEKEPYAERTAWHVPLEVVTKHTFPNVAIGLHGAVLRSLPSYNAEYMKTLIARLLEEGFELYVRGLRTAGQHLGVIAVQTKNDNVPPMRRLPGSPSFVCCPGVGADISVLERHFEGQKKTGLKGLFGPRPRLHWSAPAKDAHTTLLFLLIGVAYNLDQFAGHLLPGELVPVLDAEA